MFGIDYVDCLEIAMVLCGGWVEGICCLDMFGYDLVYVVLFVISSGIVYGVVRIIYLFVMFDVRVRIIWFCF